MDRAAIGRFGPAVLAAAVCLVLLSAAPALAVDPVSPAPAPYVVRGFGLDPLGTAGPRLLVSLDPPHPDGYFGWYVSPARVKLTADRPSLVRFVWDDPGEGTWLPYETPLLVPEGKHVLYAQATDGTRPGPLTALEVKADFRSQPVNGSEFAMRSSSASAAGGLVMVQATVNPWAGPRMVRIYGPDRYATSEQIALTNFGTAATAIVARGDNFPDALAASALAGLYDAPIVLTWPDHLPSPTTKALTELAVRGVIIVGGPKAVWPKVENDLKGMGLQVERIGGTDRYETAALISRAVVARGGQRGQAFVARGDLFPDSLAVSPFAYRARRPILLVRPNSLPSYTASALTDLGVTSVLIAGSVKAVSAGVEASIRAKGATTSRAEGSDRYGTAVASARYGVGEGLGGWALVGIATGENFPDALCGGAAVGKLSGVMLMTPKAKLCDVTRDELVLHGRELRDLQVYGSDRAVSQETWNAILATVR